MMNKSRRTTMYNEAENVAIKRNLYLKIEDNQEMLCTEPTNMRTRA